MVFPKRESPLIVIIPTNMERIKNATMEKEIETKGLSTQIGSAYFYHSKNSMPNPFCFFSA
jgi:hypothetical protein